MKRLALAMAVGAVLALPAMAVADSYIEVHESPYEAGQGVVWFEGGQKANLENVTYPFVGTGTTCAGAYAPLEYQNWSNCVSSFYLDLRYGDCVGVYNKPNYTERIDLWDARSGSKVVWHRTMGTADDKWESIRWGHWSYTNSVCVW